MARLTVEPHAPLDLARLGAVFDSAESLKGAAPAARWPFDAEEWRSWLTQPDCFPYFLRCEGEDAGHFALFARHEGARHLRWLVLRSAWRGGRGREIVSLIEGLIRDRHGVTVMTLNANTWNTRALHLYRSCGFEAVEQFPDKIAMRKDLT